MKKSTQINKKSWTQDVPVWMAIFAVMVLGFLIYATGVKINTRSSANDGVEAGVVLPVASNKE